MKKFIYPLIPFVLVAIFVISLDSCTQSKAQSNNSEQLPGENCYITKWNYEGHTYLVIKTKELGYAKSFWTVSAICHDENCKCKN